MYKCFLLLISPADALFMYFVLNKVSLHISITLVELNACIYGAGKLLVVSSVCKYGHVNLGRY